MRYASRCLLALALTCSSQGFAQATPDPTDFRNFTEYTFERTFATRTVHDAFDNGKIKLAVYIWRPVKNPRHQVILFSHGSLGGLTYDPHEPFPYIPFELLEYYVTSGYTVVVPTRRGIGESTGKFREECPYAAGKCTLADYRALAEPGMAEAIADTNAVIDQVIEGREVPKGSKILLSGVSRGGLLSARMAAERPQLVSGVIDFVGGWLSVTDSWPAEENAARVELQNRLFAAIGARARGVPMLWIYASKDANYSEATTRGFFGAFQNGGGTGKYLFVTDHPLSDGHGIASLPKLWSTEVTTFLAGDHATN